MQYNTALCILSLGLALYAFVFGWVRLMKTLGVCATSLSGLTLLEYLLKINLGIDQLFFKAYISTQTSNVGRMSPITAACIFQAGLAIVLIGFSLGKKWRPLAVGLLASSVTSFCTMAILGYVLQLPGTYGWGQLTRMALPTATSLDFLGLGIFVIAWFDGREKTGRAPRWLPIPVALGTMMASLILWLALEAKQDFQIARTTEANAEDIQNQINTQMESRLRALTRMAERWEFSGRPVQAAWEDDAANYVHDFPDLQAVEWVDSSGLIRWIVPLKGNEAKINYNILQEERRRSAAEMARRQLEPVMTQPVQLFHGGTGFVMYAPLYIGANFDGVLGGVFSGQKMFDGFLPARVAAGNSIAIFANGTRVYQRDPSPLPVTPAWIVDSKTDLPGTVWVVRVWPTPRLIAQLNTFLPKIVLIVGMGIALLLSAAVRLTQVARIQVRKIAEIEEQLRLIIEGVRDYSIIMLDREGRVATWNAGAEQIKGYPVAEIIGQHFSKFYPPEALAAHKPERELVEALSKGRVEDEGWRVRKDGSRFYANVIIAAIYDSGGQHQGFAKVTRDITERKRAEQVQHELNTQLADALTLQNAIMGSANYAIISMTLDGVVTTFNAAAQQWLGYTGAEVVGKATPSLWHDAGEIAARAKVLSVELGRTIEAGFESFVAKARLGQVDENEWTFIRKDGSRFPVLLSATALFDATGAITGFLGVIADITERKKSEAALRESEERFRLALESAPIGMALVSASGKWLKVNRALCDMFGYSEAELLLTDFQRITHPDDLETDLGFVQQVLRGEISSYQLEKRYFHKRGLIVRTMLSVSLVRDRAGQPLHFVSQIEDITKRKHAEEKMAEQAAELQRSNRELEQFAYVASHDMREPLRAVSGFAQILRKNCRAKLDPKDDLMIGHIVDGAKRMSDIIDDLLALSRIGSQGRPFEKTSLVKPLELALQNLSVAIRERGAMVRHEALPTLPVDSSQLALLFQNLIGNAVKFCRDKPPEIDVSATKEEGVFWRISVRDNGIGIEEKHFDRIFGIFQRLHTREEYEGTGIGLAICKKIVERHGGRIWLESEPDQGATFHFTLPERQKSNATQPANN